MIITRCGALNMHFALEFSVQGSMKPEDKKVIKIIIACRKYTIMLVLVLEAYILGFSSVLCFVNETYLTI